MMLNSRIVKAKKYAVTMVGSLLMATAVNIVFEPMGMVTGGISGLAIITKEITKGFMEGGFPLGLFNILCQVPLFIAAVRILGKNFLKRTLFASICFTVGLFTIPSHDIITKDYLLASLSGGVIMGVGIGMVFYTQASTGGTDLLATMIRKYKKYYTIPQILVAIDGVIVLVGAAVFGIRNALYAIIAIYISSKVSDTILEGMKFAKMAYIISEQYEKIADEIIRTLRRGVTRLPATGMYSNRERNVLFCVVSKKEIVQIIEISQHLDPNSFIIIYDVREVMGEGFIEHRQ